MPPFQVVFSVGNNGMRYALLVPSFLLCSFNSHFILVCRPDVPDTCPSAMAQLMRQCWREDPLQRPPFDKVVAFLHAMKF
mmetsp:Transcript_12028/g.20105  ORF Transcript_12028/g.20105 Transcript_12028/m.20105 type:complete len:80 (-) Transcript_12028:615-854(-)